MRTERSVLLAALMASVLVGCGDALVSARGDDLSTSEDGLAVPTGAFRGRYYDNKDFTGYVGERTDTRIDFDWARAAPMQNMGADEFTVRWDGNFEFDAAGTYVFTSTADDGVRIWVDG